MMDSRGDGQAAAGRPHRRRAAAALVLALGAAGCAGTGNGGGPDDDYLTPELRAAVERLKADVAARPTSTCRWSWSAARAASGAARFCGTRRTRR